MDEFETEVVSVDNGQPAPAPTPENPEVAVEPETPEVQPAETTDDGAPSGDTPSEPATPETPGLVQLPDGRQLPPEQASKEFRTLYSEFTRRSQRLANYENGSSPNNQAPAGNQAQPQPENGQEEWVPQTWDEVVQRSVEMTQQHQTQQQQQEAQAIAAAEANVTSQLEEIKKDNPNLNESQLFSHAMKYGFTDLKQAYSNMNDMQQIVKKTTDMTTNNIQKRNADPVSGGPQAGSVVSDDVYDPSFRNMDASDYLNSLQN